MRLSGTIIVFCCIYCQCNRITNSACYQAIGKNLIIREAGGIVKHARMCKACGGRTKGRLLNYLTLNYSGALLLFQIRQHIFFSDHGISQGLPLYVTS